ncbi:pirin family protein [Salinimonas sp. HHU 13199]|uniref:Pirin family protein n=1 Tax=Salinimonas profundi TaxID=2729140 RepID=A0ABR8LJE2_9ALTE|nr:pirin family protein [Salinimonas profundi]MBD3584427.1 pirin family protein [Salinimonas profundi]
MEYIRRAESRGNVEIDWLKSRHSFSFGHYYDPAHTGFSVLRVINDDVVKPGYGFDTHGHRDMEIITYIIDGELEHKDSQGNQAIIPVGDIQRMSAGKGILHSEFNPSDTVPTHLLQIWIMPQHHGIRPSYAQKTITQEGKLSPIVTPEGSDTAISINQDVTLYKMVLDDKEDVTISTKGRSGYLHVIKGQLATAEHTFSDGDGYGVYQVDDVTFTASERVEALWFDLPPIGQ